MYPATSTSNPKMPEYGERSWPLPADILIVGWDSKSYSSTYNSTSKARRLANADISNSIAAKG